MHILVVFVNFLSVCLRSKASQAFLIHVDFHWFVRGYQHIDAQVKFVPVDQQRIRNIFANDTCFVHIDVVDVVNNVDTAPLTSIGWLNNPHILFAFMLLQLLVVVVKVAELVWQNVGVRRKVEGLLSEALLHANYIETEAIFAGDFVTLREMVNLLVLVKTLILVTLARRGTPQEIPLVGVRGGKAVLFEHGAAKFVVKAYHFVE